MLLRDALPRFYAEATAAIAAMPDDELEDVSRAALLAQFDVLVLIEHERCHPSCGSFRVTAPGRLASRGYRFSFDFDIPSGNVVADLDNDLQILAFEPISIAAIDDLRGRVDHLHPRTPTR
jgi:hypothetical protein